MLETKVLDSNKLLILILDMAGGKILTLIGMRQGTFTPLVILGLDFVS